MIVTIVIYMVHFFSENVERLKKTYEHVDDIDLFAGGFLEQPDTGAILARVFRCIVGDSFQKLKIGDRYIFFNFQLEVEKDLFSI